MRPLAPYLILLVVGCGGAQLTPEQQVMMTHLSKQHPQLKIVKWWPAVTAEQADLPALYTTVRANNPAGGNIYLNYPGKNQGFTLFEVMRAEFEKQPAPTHFVRVKYQWKASLQSDSIFNLAGDKVVGGWFEPDSFKLPWVDQWVQQHFPDDPP